MASKAAEEGKAAVGEQTSQWGMWKWSRMTDVPDLRDIV